MKALPLTIQKLGGMKKFFCRQGETFNHAPPPIPPKKDSIYNKSTKMVLDCSPECLRGPFMIANFFEVQCLKTIIISQVFVKDP